MLEIKEELLEESDDTKCPECDEPLLEVDSISGETILCCPRGHGIF